MTDEELIELVDNEFKNPTFGTMKQYLDIHSPVIQNGKIAVARIDRVSHLGYPLVYIPVVKEKFFFGVFCDENAKKITGLRTEPYCSVYLCASSYEKTAAELSKTTTLILTESWSKGNPRSNGRGVHKFSRIIVEPNKEPDTFENKLSKLIDHLEQDMDGVNNLVESYSACIRVAMEFHNGNTMLGGMVLRTRDIKRLNSLNIDIDFDLYVGGKLYVS